MEALIYTRPYSTDNGVDYCCFCRPSILSDKEYSEALHHARNVMNTELDGDIQNECRWHILRISDYILVGVATTRFGRKDQVNRRIRGYYGILMPKDSAFIPNWESFEYLDSAHVAPLFESKQPFSPVTPALVAEAAIAPYENEEEHNVPIDFNFEKDKIKIMPVPEARELYSLLRNALKCAKTHTDFNFVCGLNTKYYASSKPFMNALCYNVKEESVIALKTAQAERRIGAFEGNSSRKNLHHSLSGERSQPAISRENCTKAQGIRGNIWTVAGCACIGVCAGLVVVGKPVVAVLSGISGGIMMMKGMRKKQAHHRERVGIIPHVDNHTVSTNYQSEKLHRFGLREKREDKQDTPQSYKEDGR